MAEANADVAVHPAGPSPMDRHGRFEMVHGRADVATIAWELLMRGLTPPSPEHNARMAELPQWEEGPLHTFRLKVPGGWLYRYGDSGAMAFVPEAGSYRPLDMNWPT